MRENTQFYYNLVGQAIQISKCTCNTFSQFVQHVLCVVWCRWDSSRSQERWSYFNAIHMIRNGYFRIQKKFRWCKAYEKWHQNHNFQHFRKIILACALTVCRFTVPECFDLCEMAHLYTSNVWLFRHLFDWALVTHGVRTIERLQSMCHILNLSD